MYSALRQGYIYILSRVDRLAALKGAAEPRKRRLKAQWFYAQLDGTPIRPAALVRVAGPAIVFDPKQGEAILVDTGPTRSLV